MNVLNRITASRYYLLWILLLIILFSFLRLVYINADLPQDLTISASIYTDEGFKTYGPRNMVLYGEWKWTQVDEYENWVSRSPIPTDVYTRVFQEFGIGFSSIRIVSAVFSIATMILLFLFTSRCCGRTAGAVSLLLMGTNFISTMFSRLGFFEQHLNFFIIMSLFSFYEFGRSKARDQNSNLSEKLAYYCWKIILLLLGTAGMIAAFYTKRSFLVIIVAIIPAIVLLVAKRIAGTRAARRMFTAMLAGLAVLYLLLAHIGKLQYIMNLFLSLKVFGKPLITYIPLKSFDPIHLAAGKGMYIEFIFLQPMTFLIAFLFAFYVLYRFLTKDDTGKETSALDLYLASWLLFGFIILTMMSYHPARYYLMLLVPLVVLASRFIAGFSITDLKGFLQDRQPVSLRVVMNMFAAVAVLYSGVVLVVHLLPFSLRNSLMKSMYPSFISGDFTDALPIMAGLALFEIAAVVLVILFRTKLLNLLLRPGFATGILTAILAFHLFQYGKWVIFREYDLYNLSRELGEELRENAIIIGSWSAGFVIENRLRALVIQDKNPYNTEVVRRLIENEGIPVTFRTPTGSINTIEKNQPLYLAVCEDVVFEMSILERYRRYIKRENLKKKVSLGYFNVNLYRIKRTE